MRRAAFAFVAASLVGVGCSSSHGKGLSFPHRGSTTAAGRRWSGDGVRALASSRSGDVARVLAPAVRARYVAKPFPILPPGSSITNVGAPKVTGDLATVTVTLRGSPQAGRWDVLFVRSNGGWLIYGTRRPQP